MLFMIPLLTSLTPFFLLAFLLRANALAGAAAVLLWLIAPNATPASGSTLFDAQLAWRIMLPVSTRVQAACLGL